MKWLTTGSVTGIINAGRGKRDLRLGLLAGLLALLLVPGALSVQAQDDDGHYGPRPTGQAKSLERDKAARKAHAGNADVLVLPGLVANRKTRQVEVLAESTGLRAESELEFLLVDKDSSHGYEAMLWSHAKPSDVHRALEFIGLKPGHPFNPSAMRFWADGDPVNLSVTVDGGIPFPIEKMVLDNETETTLPEDGFIFTGSVTVPSPDGSGAQAYMADVYDPRSVASIYNEPGAVLDVPRQADKGELYGRQVVNPEKALEGETLLTILMEPGKKAQRAPTPRLELALAYPAAATSVVFRLSEAAEGKVLADAPELLPVLAQLSALRQDDIVPFIKLQVAENLPLAQIVKPSVSLAMMESLGMIRMDPPADGQLYYRAFVPQKMWMQPEGRPSQPWELHLRLQDGKVAGTMVFNQPDWTDSASVPTFTRRTLETPDPAALRQQLDADAKAREAAGKTPLPGVLLVFAAPDLTYGMLLEFLKPVQHTHGTIYIFVR